MNGPSEYDERFGDPSTPANRVCAIHYTKPPKTSTCGKCPIQTTCHTPTRSVGEWMQANNIAAVTWELSPQGSLESGLSRLEA
jgi:hypothetical protein